MGNRKRQYKEEEDGWVLAAPKSFSPCKNCHLAYRDQDYFFIPAVAARRAVLGGISQLIWGLGLFTENRKAHRLSSHEEVKLPYPNDIPCYTESGS